MNLTHVDSSGKANMVDVSEKASSFRTAKAFCRVLMNKDTFFAVKNNEISKGDVLTTAKIAGIQAAKNTSSLIPLCHNIFISKIDIDFNLDEDNFSIEIFSFAKTNSQTGIEMEALTAVSIAGLTVYDMCKAMDKSIRISDIQLIEKTGGKSGDYYKEII